MPLLIRSCVDPLGNRFTLSPMNYRLDDEMTEEEAKLIRRRLVEFADQHTGPRNGRNFGVVLRDEEGRVVGGITANTVWDWLQISEFWISEELRGRGFGRQLLARAEEIARQHGCRFAKLDTFEFEGREFYERHGYVVQSSTADFPKGHTQFHLVKEL